MARMDDDAQQPVGRCGTSIHPQEDRQDRVIDLTVKHIGSLQRPEDKTSRDSVEATGQDIVISAHD